MGGEGGFISRAALFLLWLPVPLWSSMHQIDAQNISSASYVHAHDERVPYVVHAAAPVLQVVAQLAEHVAANPAAATYNRKPFFALLNEICQKKGFMPPQVGYGRSVLQEGPPGGSQQDVSCKEHHGARVRRVRGPVSCQQPDWG